jgi:hypothetical protein
MLCQSVEHVPLRQLYTVACDAFMHASVVDGCTGFVGSSCSTHPQLLSAHVALVFAHGGIQCWMSVPPTEDAMRPMGTGSAFAYAGSAARVSAIDCPKYQQTAENLLGKPSASASSFMPALLRGRIHDLYEFVSVLFGQTVRRLGKQTLGKIHELALRGPM